MANRPIRLSIEPEKFDRRYAKVYTSRDGKVRRFYQLVAWENRDGRDDKGNTHLVKQGLPMEFKDQGVDPNSLPIVGNLSMPEEDNGRRQSPAPSRQQPSGRTQSSSRPAPKPQDPNEDWGS